MISIIVAKAKNGVIGNKNDLPWYLPTDMIRFKSLTHGHSVIMGRKTFESILARINRPLPDRRNIVVTRDKQFSFPGAVVVHSLPAAFDQADHDAFVIGGTQIYQQALPLVNRLYVTEIQAEVHGDVYFPKINSSEWQEVSRETHQKDDRNSYDYDFVIYDRLKNAT